jgi:hypothetical protein
VTRLLADAGERAALLRDVGVVRLVECADPAVAVFIAGDRALRHYCQPAGDRHITVQVEHEQQFRKALLGLGYVLPGDATPAASPRVSSRARD